MNTSSTASTASTARPKPTSRRTSATESFRIGGRADSVADSLSDEDFEMPEGFDFPELPPGSDQVFEFGQHKGLTFHQVLKDSPGFYVWARKEKLPGKKLKEFLTWVGEHYSVTVSYTHLTLPTIYSV